MLPRLVYREHDSENGVQFDHNENQLEMQDRLRTVRNARENLGPNLPSDSSRKSIDTRRR